MRELEFPAVRRVDPLDGRHYAILDPENREKTPNPTRSPAGAVTGNLDFATVCAGRPGILPISTDFSTGVENFAGTGLASKGCRL